MNYNRKDLADLYGQVRGKEVPDHKHLQVYGEGTSEDHNIAPRNDIGYKDKNGNWIFKRASGGFINDIMVPEMAYAESASYLKTILNHGIKAGVIDEGESIKSEKVQKLYKYLSRDAPRSELRKIVSSLPDKKLQSKFIQGLNNPTSFNFYEVINSELGTSFGPDESVVTMRPAGEDKKTRGAAGPGEALLAFLYNGRKPEVGDLDLNGTTIELKYNGGRIGKGVNTSNVKKLVGMFFNLGASGKLAGTLTKDGIATIENEYKDKTLADFLADHSGVDISDVDRGYFGRVGALDWFKKNNKAARGIGGGSAFDKIAQIVAAIQMKAYFNKIKPFDYLGVFDAAGNIAGFDRNDLLKSNANEIIEKLAKKSVILAAKTPPDESGFQISLQK
tara:strand:- start:50 stop:1219 length:1170 start_codon:yes stop_codon:yes gene_type:complete